jgi:hypothetical protein
VFIIIVGHRVTGTQVVVDLSRDVTNLFDISCPYNDDYRNFWVYGCPTTPSDDIYPNITGFWAACNKNCEIIYNNRGSLSNPVKLWVATYIEGDSSISVSGTNKAGRDVYDFGSIQSKKNTEWCYTEIDIAKFPDASVSNSIILFFDWMHVYLNFNKAF